MTLPSPSSYARLAEGLVRAASSESYIATEWRALRGGSYGGFDFSFPVRAASGEIRWVHVDVDGQGHTQRGLHGETVTDQQARDREKDDAAWAAKLMLVRLHHRDLREWFPRLRAAAYVAAQPRQGRFVFYTKSHRELGLSTKTEPL